MDPLDVAQKFGSTGAWAAAALFLAISAYLGIKSMAPVWAERYKLQTKLLTARDARHADEIVRKLNGRVYVDIERHLISSDAFRARFASKHQMNAVEAEQQRIFGKIDEHMREDREVHERVKGLETEMTEVKQDLRDIRDDLREAAKTVTAEARALREERGEGERRIIDHINELYERREKVRA
jgi:septal ring factor EnvC (AmiA/AmiB activator)